MDRNNNNPFQMIADYEGDIQSLFDTSVEGLVPILATRNMVLFPGVVAPVLIGRPASLKLVREIMRRNSNQILGVFCQKDPSVEEPDKDELYEYGVCAKIIRVLDMPQSDNVTVIVQGLSKCHLDSITEQEPHLKGMITPIREVVPSVRDREFKTAMEALRDCCVEYVKKNEDIPDEALFALKNISNDVIALNFICSNMPFSPEQKIHLLTCSTLTERVMETLKTVNREMQLNELKQDIRTRTREDIDEQQREYFLQQQIKNLKEELGGGEGSPERLSLVEQAREKLWSEEVERTFYKELDKLDMLNPQSPDYSIQMNYLQTMVSLPWNEYTKDDLNLKRAERILNQDHYGMEKVKERILEYMAVLSLRGDLKSPILCLYGPPGVGKTSLGKSIASAMKRKYVRMSLGGLHDESEIRGHRRTYIGAMPGRIIKSIQRAGSSNPVFILDEIDKVTQHTINGDPASALLEVLDPEQNNAFHDNYLDVDYDLSKVLFIATANDLNTIPRALLDRMEVIEVSGYITEEKIEIAKRHLVPRELENTGMALLTPKPSFNKAALERIIEQYTRESGVRQLEKQINKALRKMAAFLSEQL